MTGPNQNWSVIHLAQPSSSPFTTSAPYTLPTYGLASQIFPMPAWVEASILIDPTRPILFDIRPSTNGLRANAQLLMRETSVRVSEEVARHLSSIFGELERIGGLPENWDTFGSVKTSPDAATMARELVWSAVIEVAASKSADGTPYAVAPLSGGGVQIEWRGQAGIIEVEVSPEGHFSYLLRRGGDGLGEAEEDEKVPRERLLGLISSVV